MDEDQDLSADQLTELHFLAALTDELMRVLWQSGALSRAQLNEIEEAAAKRVGSVPRPW
ncbi:hypothetical protein [Sphingomonas xinjiangensis]|uniref:Uncharacterized protein n=1 Tax=Sphingomonas xinjiangensis TaxID=643568 RepID=A0A840YI06_9SPHN|nr:hypothetical protein [Sphingomonas xinjiangensis]MBB5712035.1 hypothetical protein [Sphingomonas xinjiangensis]